MRLYQLEEGVNTNVLVVDIQPAYAPWADKIAPSVMNLLNRQTGEKYIMYNGINRTPDHGYGGLSETDTEQDVIDYFLKHGLDQNQVKNLTFIEKEFFFFREWMDKGVPESMIIRTVRAMVQSAGETQSDYLDINTVFNKQEQRVLRDQYDIRWRYDTIYMPDFVSLALLKKISPFLMCGGGRDRCLREIELICNAFNIRYKRIDTMLYPPKVGKY